MAFSESLDAFLADFGVDVVFGDETGKAILDSPDLQIMDGGMLSTEYSIQFVTSEFTFETGNTISVDGSNYRVRERYKLDDGKFSRASLQKL